MTLIELPHALEEYFAFAETDPTRHGRRFSITLPYLSGERLERLQWWYHVSPAQELMFEGKGLDVFRSRAIERFRRHIEHWLAMTNQRIHGDDAIPCICAQKPSATISSVEIAANHSESPPAWAAQKKRAAVGG